MKDDQSSPDPLILNYAIEYPPNQAIVCIHLAAKIPDLGMFSRDKETDESKSLRDALMSIPGVVEVYAYKQSVSITRGGAYVWPGIVSHVIEALRLFTKSDLAEEVPLYA